MEGFSYTNIFETKGTEYLVIIAFLAMLIPFWVLLNKQVKITKHIQKVLGNLSVNILKIPQGLFYSKNHTWAHLQESGIAKVGLDDLLLHLTGEVKLGYLRQPGEIIIKDDLLAEIDQNGKFLKIFSPISGKIIHTNSLLNENPEMLNEDPYGRGWICKIKPSNWVVETNSYYLAEDATLFSRQELDKFKEFISASIGKYSPQPSMLILQDGGELLDQPLPGLPPEAWQEFQEDFMGKKTYSRNKGCLRNKESQTEI